MRSSVRDISTLRLDASMSYAVARHTSASCLLHAPRIHSPANRHMNNMADEKKRTVSVPNLKSNLDLTMYSKSKCLFSDKCLATHLFNARNCSTSVVPAVPNPA